MSAILIVVAYLCAGLLLASGSLINGILAPRHRARAFAAILIAWPLVALVAPDVFFSRSSFSEDSRDRLAEKLSEVLAQGLNQDEELRNSLRQLAADGEHSVAYFAVPGDLDRVLEDFWNLDVPPKLYSALARERFAIASSPCDVPAPLLSVSEPEWYVGFSREFLKCIARADGKTRGRVLDAISKISHDPTAILGDTIKPLKADLEGLWRCRIGDDRLIYMPDKSTRKITLVSFGARGSIYD